MNEPASERQRTFIGLPLGPADARVLAALLSTYREQIGATVRWLPRARWHVTLRFLGSTPVAMLPRLVAGIGPAAAQIRPARLAIRALGPFPRPRPVTIAFRLEPAPWLAALAARLEALAVGLGFPPEGRTFRPHVTVGRLRRPSAGLPREAFAGGPALRPDSLVLYRSETLPAGARYRVLRRWPLRPSGNAVE